MSAKPPAQNEPRSANGAITGNDPTTKTPVFRYTAALATQVETKWQDIWEREGTFEAPNPAGPWLNQTKLQVATNYLFSTCFRTRPAPGCTLVTLLAI